MRSPRALCERLAGKRNRDNREAVPGLARRLWCPFCLQQEDPGMFQVTDSKRGTGADRAAAMVRSGVLGRRLVNLSQLAAAAHRAQVAEQIVRGAQGSPARASRSDAPIDGAAA